MKRLQNNFTTIAQSKRLLGLGVPADSADCYWNDICLKPIPMQVGILYSDKRNRFTKVNVPVWSVGRLIEIMALCYKFDLPSSGSICIYATDVKKGSVVDTLISDIERYISQLDFSKLDE